MFDSKSDYALNKADPEAIVCKSVTGVHIRLTREDFATDEEFITWKKWSDCDYKKIESAGRGFFDNCISLSEGSASLGISAQDAFLAPLMQIEQEEQITAMLQQVKAALTETQYRRLWMYCVEKKTEIEIAQAENVGQPRICRSLRRAQKILEKIFPENIKTGDKKG